MAKKDKNKQKGASNQTQGPNSNAFMKQMKQNIQQKMKTDQRKDVDLEEIKEKERIQQEEQKKKEKEKEGVKVPKPYNKRVKQEAGNWKEILKRTVAGGVAAGCSVVPGASTSVLIGRTPTLIGKICESFVSLFKPRSFIDWVWNFLWMLPFLVVFLGAFVLSYYVYFQIQEAGYGIAMVFMFIGMTIFTIPLLYFLNWSHPHLPINRKQFEDAREQNKKPAWVWALLAFGFVLIIGLSFVVRFAWSSDGYPAGTLNLEQFEMLYTETGNINQELASSISNLEALTNHTIQTAYAIQVLAAGFLAGFTMLIPGLSGSFFMGVLGCDSSVNIAVKYAFTGYTFTDNAEGIQNTLSVNSSWAWSVVVIMFIGAFCGIVASLFFIKTMSSKFQNGFNALVLGFYVASVFAGFISISNADYKLLGQDSKVLAASLTLLFGMSIPGFIWMMLYQKLGFINVKWLSFANKININVKSKNKEVINK